MSFKVKKSRTFVTITNYHLKDPELSLEAKGLHTWLLSCESDWTGDFEDILRFHVNLQRTDLVRILNELKLMGYIEIDKDNNYIVNERPINRKIKDTSVIQLEDEVNKTKPKNNLYTKCSNFVYDFTDNEALQNVLIEYLKMRLNPSQDSRLANYRLTYFNQWKSILYDLDTFTGNKVKIVERSLKKQWAKFFELEENKTRDGVKSNSYTQEEIENFKKRAKELENKGEQGIF